MIKSRLAVQSITNVSSGFEWKLSVLYGFKDFLKGFSTQPRIKVSRADLIFVFSFLHEKRPSLKMLNICTGWKTLSSKRLMWTKSCISPSLRLLFENTECIVYILSMPLLCPV